MTAPLLNALMSSIGLNAFFRAILFSAAVFTVFELSPQPTENVRKLRASVIKMPLIFSSFRLNKSKVTIY
jgi:hypothetical protein